MILYYVFIIGAPRETGLMRRGNFLLLLVRVAVRRDYYFVHRLPLHLIPIRPVKCSVTFLITLIINYFIVVIAFY